MSFSGAGTSLRRLASVALLLIAAAAFGAADTSTKPFNLPADGAERALKLFSEQSGLEVLFPTDTVKGIRTNAVQGQMTARAALEAMLADTGLKIVEDSKTGALTVRRESPVVMEKNATSRRETDAAAEKTVEMQAVEVTGSRIRGLLGEASIQPVLTLTSTEIERTGATSLGEVFRYVPQISSYSEGQFVQSAFAFGASSGDITSSRVTASLRGAPAGGTLLLINGRRAPRTGQETGQDSGDLSGIPLAAIDRIEVLLDGASAIYGSDAVGGVINVILKRNYQGTEIKVSYGNTFDSDVHEFSASATYGFAQDKLSGIVTVGHEEGGNLMWVDRDILKTQDRRAWGGTNATSFQIPSMNGTISVGAGNTAGVPGNTLLTIPVGSNGTNKTPADFVAAGSPPAPPGTDLARWASYNSPYDRSNLVSSFEYDYKPNMTPFGEFRISKSKTNILSSPLAISSLSIPANAPGNVFGVPVTMRRYLTDLVPHPRISQNQNLGATAGIKGTFGHDWRYEGSVNYTHTRAEYDNTLGFSAVADNFAEALANPDASKRPNLFYDATTPGLNPNPPGLLESLGAPDRNLEIGQVWTYSVQADGPVWDLWAGELRMAVGAEYREEYVDFPIQSPDDLFGARAKNRNVNGVFAEMRLPLISERQHIPLVNMFEVTAAVRRDSYKEFPDATKPRYGVMYRPFKWMMLRGSYGEGYKVPTLSQLYAPARTTTGTIGGSGLVDIYRGNEAFIGPQLLTVGGNPNLVPEETESTTAGAVIDIPGKTFKGLSFSYDYYQHKYLNRISALSLADRLMIFPELFQRQPNLPTDPPGWPGPFGPVLTYDGRSVNVSTNDIAGWDAGLRYFRPTPWGEFTLTYNASKTTTNRAFARPGAPQATNSVPQALPLKMSGALYWKTGAYETGAIMSYRARFKRTLTERLTPSAIRWDWRGSVDFSDFAWARPNSDRMIGRWLSNTKLSVTIFNVLDTDPPIGSAGIPESSLLDALGRRFSVSVTKSFGGDRSRIR